MSNVKLLQLKDNLTLTEACAYLVGLTGVEDNNAFNYIAGLVNDYKLNLYLRPDKFYKEPYVYCSCSLQYSEVTLIGEQKFLKVCLSSRKTLTMFSEGEEVSSVQECSFFIDEGSKIEGDVFAGTAFQRSGLIDGDDFSYNDIPPHLNDDEIAEAHSLACKTHKNKISEFSELLHQTDKEEDLFRIDGSNFLYIKRKEIDPLLESLPTKSASQTDQTDQTELEKQMQEKINVLSAKIAQLESENLELKEENKGLEKQLEPKPTPSTYTIAGALIELITDQKTPRRNQAAIKDELENKFDGCSRGSLNNFFQHANIALNASKAKG